MEVMTEKDRKKLIFDTYKFGGISLRHQILRLHKNGAKFPISKVYIDDGLLDPDVLYTLILLPEANIAAKKSVILSFFQRNTGPVIWDAFPNDIPEREKSNIVAVMAHTAKEGFYIHQTSAISSLNYYFEIPSEWARGNKEMLMVSVILDRIIDDSVEKTVKTLLTSFVSKLKESDNLYKALYVKDLDKYSEEQQSDILKISENLRSILKETYQKIKLSTNQIKN